MLRLQTSQKYKMRTMLFCLLGTRNDSYLKTKSSELSKELAWDCDHLCLGGSDYLYIDRNFESCQENDALVVCSH